MRSERQGFAVVLVVLITAIVLMTFLFASMTMTLTSRSSAEQSRDSTQALLAADSGLETLHALASTQPYSTALYNNFTDYIEQEFPTLSLGNGVAANLTVLSEDATTVTVESTGTSGNATRVVIQDFRKHVPQPQNLAVNVPGALTSVGTINTNSNSALVEGRDNSVDSWTYADHPACDAEEGEYLSYGGVTYKVTDTSACPSGDVGVTDISSGSTGTISGSELVTLMPTAVTASVGSCTGTCESTIPVTAATTTLFGNNRNITIGGSTGKVVGVDTSTNELTVDWTSGFGGASEGDVVRSTVYSGVTSTDQQCDMGTNGSTSFPNGCTNSDLSSLFYKTFGTDQTTLQKEIGSSCAAYPNCLPDSQMLTGSQITSSNVLSGWTWVTNPDNNFRNQTGSGILIIQNDPGQSITLNVNSSFVGLIYVIGDANIQGNGTYPGAIIVDGSATIDTSVQGTTHIAYDPLELMRVLASLKVPNPQQPWLGHPVADTWRIK